MARRPKKQSLIDIAINGGWQVSATLAVILLIIIFVVNPSIANPFLIPLALGLKPIGFFLIAVFGVIAIVKFILQNKAQKQSKPSLTTQLDTRSAVEPSWNELPKVSLSFNEKASNTPIRGSVGNSSIQLETLPPKC